MALTETSEDTLEAKKTLYSTEFFHIYTDEQIGPIHEASLHYLQEAKKAWEINDNLILLIDNYNPTVHTLKVEEVFDYLAQHGATPPFWAYEGDLIDNAKILLDNITAPKLQRSYNRYVENHGKYPCSLLTATWYLTRLGALPHEGIIKSTGEFHDFTPAQRLINILPQDYKPIELKAMELIRHSSFSGLQDKIQDLFFPMTSGRKDSLW
ncbi:MAG TPA: hypothetical protein VHB72_02160 [Candidatus Saccharimonadales bacterium]|nr:hypothetical protein [Candidatus Saccharimonadales bacterium]